MDCGKLEILRPLKEWGSTKFLVIMWDQGCKQNRLIFLKKKDSCFVKSPYFRCLSYFKTLCRLKEIMTIDVDLTRHGRHLCSEIICRWQLLTKGEKKQRRKIHPSLLQWDSSYQKTIWLIGTDVADVVIWRLLKSLASPFLGCFILILKQSGFIWHLKV